MKPICKTAMQGIGVPVILAILTFPAALSSIPFALPDEPVKSIAPYFIPATSTPKAPDKDGFIQRWLLLEPITKPNRTNTVFTGTYVRNTFTAASFPSQFDGVPRDGEKVTVENQELAWHALDSTGIGRISEGDPSPPSFCGRPIPSDKVHYVNFPGNR
jgi:hypothetical protein